MPNRKEPIGMAKVRLMNQTSDFENFGVNPHQVEPWEDAKRDDDRAGVYEWWYFDMILDDGSKAVIHFNTKDNKTIGKDGTIPSVVIKITSPTGKEFKDNVILKAEEASFGKEQCDVNYGPHYVKGDLQDYHIYVAPTGGVNGTDGAGGTGEASSVGADLMLHSTSSAWRPGAGGFAFDEDEKGYFTWLCAVPRGQVTGTLFYDGESHQVTGAGYHDHQWGNMKHFSTWDHWLWGRQDFGDYTLLIFDIGTQKTFNNQRLPMMFLEDNDGNLLFENTDHAPKCQVLEEYKEKLSGKSYPKKVAYEFKQGDKTIKYVITQKEELEARDAAAEMPKPLSWVLEKAKKLHPSTTRNFAHGELIYDDGQQVIKREGDMIYEFIYMGLTAKDQMENG